MFGPQAVFGNEEKVHFPGTSISFWTGMADTVGFKDLRFLIIFGLSLAYLKALQKDFRERLYFPFSGFSMLPLFGEF